MNIVLRSSLPLPPWLRLSLHLFGIFVFFAGIGLVQPLGMLAPLEPAAGAQLRAAAPPEASSSFSESTEVTAVQVPVQVLRDGEPGRGLAAADFQVFDGKSRQKVTRFQ